MILLSILCAIFLGLTVLFLRLAMKASRTISNYENFYDSTLSDVDSVLEMLDGLMARRRVVADDPDVQNVYRVIGITRDILTGYTNAGLGKRKDGKQEQRREEAQQQ